MLLTFLLVTLFELIYMSLKTININRIVQNKALEAALISGFMTILWLISTTIGIFSILEGNLIIAVGYVIGSTIGCYIGIKYENREKEK
jgi:uncharacterized protein YebE (UPF0316 family)